MASVRPEKSPRTRYLGSWTRKNLLGQSVVGGIEEVRVLSVLLGAVGTISCLSLVMCAGGMLPEDEPQDQRNVAASSEMLE